MKKQITRITVLLLILSLAGCGKSKTEESTVRVEDIKNTVMDIKEITFAGTEDSQPYWNVFSHPLAAGEYGYYFMMQDRPGNVLEHIDAETCKRVIVCNQPQCDHADNTCPAVFEDEQYEQAVWYYQNHLYFIKSTQEGQAILVQTNADGTDRKELFEIGNAAAAQIYNLVFCDGSVYIYNRTGNCNLRAGVDVMQINIRKRSLDGKTDINIITSDEENAIFDAVKAYGGNVFFVYTHTTFDQETRTNTTTGEGLFCYNTRSGKIGKIIDKEVCDFAVDEKNYILYYYVIQEGLYRYELDTGIDTLIYPAQRNTMLCQVSCDGSYIYLDNGRWCSFTRAEDLSKKVWILDTDGTPLYELDNQKAYASFFGDGRYLFIEVSRGLPQEGAVIDRNHNPRVNYDLNYILKSDIPSGNVEWRTTEW